MNEQIWSHPSRVVSGGKKSRRPSSQAHPAAAVRDNFSFPEPATPNWENSDMLLLQLSKTRENSYLSNYLYLNAGYLETALKKCMIHSCR